MDLYIQVGVILLFLAAFSLFVYYYTQPAELFSDGIQETSAQISQQVENIRDMDIKGLYLNTNVSGSEIKNIISKSEAKNLAVLVQTRSQDELIVNYGYQMRPNKSNATKMNPYGYMDTAPIEFELNFVTTTRNVFFSENAGFTIHHGDKSGGLRTSNTNIRDLNMLNYSSTGQFSTTYPKGSELRRLTSSAPTKSANNPIVTMSNPLETIIESKHSGENFNSSGFLYTDQVLSKNATNTNLGHAESKQSNYYISDNSEFLTTLIIDSNNEVIGVYAEEKIVNSHSNILKVLMVNSGIITN